MKKKFLCVGMVLFICSASPAFADLLLGSGGFGWQDLNSFVLNENGTPFFDNTSLDGSKKNVGYWLTNTGAFAGKTDGPGALPFWGIAAGGFDKNVYFDSNSASVQAAMKLEIAGYANFNSFGWYEVDSGVRHEIFNGASAKGASTTFSPGEDYGFYLINKPGNIFYSQAGAFGTVDANFQHFAFFKEADHSYYIGIEDLLCGGDKDYNDMVIKISAVPEPASMLLLGAGLLALASFGRRVSKR